MKKNKNKKKKVVYVIGDFHLSCSGDNTKKDVVRGTNYPHKFGLTYFDEASKELSKDDWEKLLNEDWENLLHHWHKGKPK